MTTTTGTETVTPTGYARILTRLYDQLDRSPTPPAIAMWTVAPGWAVGVIGADPSSLDIPGGPVLFGDGSADMRSRIADLSDALVEQGRADVAAALAAGIAATAPWAACDRVSAIVTENAGILRLDGDTLVIAQAGETQTLPLATALRVEAQHPSSGGRGWLYGDHGADWA